MALHYPTSKEEEPEQQLLSAPWNDIDSGVMLLSDSGFSLSITGPNTPTQIAGPSYWSYAMHRTYPNEYETQQRHSDTVQPTEGAHYRLPIDTSERRDNCFAWLSDPMDTLAGTSLHPDDTLESHYYSLPSSNPAYDPYGAELHTCFSSHTTMPVSHDLRGQHPSFSSFTKAPFKRSSPLSSTSPTDLPRPCLWRGCHIQLDDVSVGGIKRHLRACHHQDAVDRHKSQRGLCQWGGSKPCHREMDVVSFGKHIASVHLRSTAHECPYCGAVIGRLDSLKRHMAHNCPKRDELCC